MGFFGGRECNRTLRKEKWNDSAGLKQLKIAKRKVGTQQLACLAIIQDGCSTCPPQQSHKYTSA